jgi:aspartate/glutamate racemase
MNLLDDSLSADLARSGTGPDDRMKARFVALARYATGTGADAILFTCSAFGACIDEVKRVWPALPVLKPNEAMIEEAVRLGGRIGLVASFEPTLRSMPDEFPPAVSVRPVLATGALEALQRGNAGEHDRLVAEAAKSIAGECDVIALAQFTMARAGPTVERIVDVPVLTTPSSAVRALRARLGSTAGGG